jgi:hypothetical protein
MTVLVAPLSPPRQVLQQQRPGVGMTEHGTTQCQRQIQHLLVPGAAGP